MAPHKVDIVARVAADAAKRRMDSERLSELFSELLLPYFDVPDQRQWNIWLRRYDVEIIALSLERCAEKYENMTEMVEKAIAEGRPVPEGLKAGWSQSEMYKWVTKVMINKTAEAHG